MPNRSISPPVPHWMQSYRLAGYRNIYELLPDETRIYGTEDLYGDWNGQLLVLLKTFCGSGFIERRKASGHPRPFSHEWSWPTNKRLTKRADLLRTCENPSSCGIMYGSALAGLLPVGDEIPDQLPRAQDAIDYGSSVLRYVISRMPSLTTVLCLGPVAWECAASAFSRSVDWEHARDASQDGEHGFESGDIACVAGFLPTARVPSTIADRAWSLVQQRLNPPPSPSSNAA